MQNKLKSGDQYSIRHFFSGNRKILIPDMQREYCWPSTIADTNQKSLVYNFVDSLIKLQQANIKIGLGLLYAYEHPVHSVQLCDGQQRLTTLYILIGLLCRRIKSVNTKEELIEILISKFEQEHDDQEPRLQYAIRESTLFFLRDLVHYYFIESNNLINGSKGIREQPWYFNEYDLDPSIQNMLRAIDEIETMLIDNSDVFVDEFAKFITTKILFLYFDMKNRKHGEEQFVVLNTTGKPLTTTENFKPLFLGGLNDSILQHYADIWEEWEQFFWEHRKKNKTSDKGLNEFFRWIYIIEQSCKVKTLSTEREKYCEAQKVLAGDSFNLLDIAGNEQNVLDIINSYFIALKKIATLNNIKEQTLSFEEKKTGIQCFELLPVLYFVKLFDHLDINDRRVLRIIQFYHSRARNDNIQKSINITAIEAIKNIELLKQNNFDDIAKIISLRDQVSSTILSQGEIYKFNVFLNNPNKRELYENTFWDAENLECCKGDILYIFELIGVDLNTMNFVFDLDAFTRAKSIVENTINVSSDLLRRALLTFGNYCIWDGNTVTLEANRYSFGRDTDFYRKMVQDDTDQGRVRKEIIMSFLKIFLFLEEINEHSIENKMNDVIKSCPNPDEDATPWEIAMNIVIKDPKQLEYMKNKLIALTYDKTKVYALAQQKVTGDDTYREISNGVYDI